MATGFIQCLDHRSSLHILAAVSMWKSRGVARRRPYLDIQGWDLPLGPRVVFDDAVNRLGHKLEHEVEVDLVRLSWRQKSHVRAKT